MGAGNPFTFDDLVAHAALGSNTALFFKEVMTAEWLKWFPSDPPPQTPVPRQMALLVLEALELLKTTWEDAGDAAQVKEEAKATYAILSGAAKKRRAEQLDDMVA
jgi:hypothetical protein